MSIEDGESFRQQIGRLKRRDSPHIVPFDRAVQGLIGLHLRNMYAELVEQPLPEHLLYVVRRIANPDQDDGAQAVSRKPVGRSQ